MYFIKYYRFGGQSFQEQVKNYNSDPLFDNPDEQPFCASMIPNIINTVGF